MLKKLISFFILISFLIIPNTANAFLPEYYGTSQASKLLSQIQFTDVRSHWAKGPILKMAALGIIRGVGGNKFNPNGTLTKEQALILLLRAMGLGDEAEARAAELVAKDGEKPTNLTGFIFDGYLDVAVDEGILTDTEAKELKANRTKAAQRQEVAYWTSKALGLEPIYGTKQKLIHGFRDVNSFDPRYVSAIEALLQERIMSGTSSTTFNPQGSMKRGEMAALLERIFPRLAEKQNITVDKGVVRGKSSRREGNTWQSLWEIRTDGFQLFNLVTGGSREVIVYKNGKLGSSSLLQVGDRVTFYLNPSQEVEFIEATASPEQQIFGSIASFDPSGKTITVTDSSGVSRAVSLASSPIVIIDNRPATINDLVIGQDVELTLKNGVVQQINGTLGLELVAYSPPRRGIQTGWIKDITSDELILVNDSGKQEIYKLQNGILVSENGKRKGISNLQVGDRVKLYLSDKDTGEIERIEISSFVGQVVRVIQGKLTRVYPSGTRVALENVQELENGQWYKAEGFDFVNLSPDVEIYARGGVITPDELAKSFIGETIYLAFISNFGNPEGVKLVVKEGEPVVLSDTIDAILWAGHELELKRNSETIQLNPGTIVTKNNRLVDPEDLTEDEQVILLGNRTSNGINSVIVASNTYYPRDFVIYQGLIDEIEARDFEIVYYSVLEGNSWEDPSTRTRGKDLEFDNDTVIYDFTLDGKQISPDKFAESRWSGYYEGYYVFAVTKDDKVLTMTLWDDRDLGDYPDELKTSLGRVTKVDSLKGEVTLERVVDWSETYIRWIRNDFPLRLDISNAIVYREDELLTIDDIKVGDKLYLIHDQYRGFVIFIQ